MGEQEIKANNIFSALCPGLVWQYTNPTCRVKHQHGRSSNRVRAEGSRQPGWLGVVATEPPPHQQAGFEMPVICETQRVNQHWWDLLGQLHEEESFDFSKPKVGTAWMFVLCAVFESWDQSRRSYASCTAFDYVNQLKTYLLRRYML